MSLHVNDLQIDILQCVAEHLIAGHYHNNFIEFSYVPTSDCACYGYRYYIVPNHSSKTANLLIIHFLIKIN